MPIIRESPRAKVSGEQSSAQWPPRSPFQALLSSPSGRKKWRDYNETNGKGGGRSVSPSPVKHVRKAAGEMVVGSGEEVDEHGDEEENEDEEMLELKLEALKAKLKLKKLQKAKKEGGSLSSRPADAERAVQVPLSPVKERRPPEQAPPSPARARLGLHATAKAQDVSLKRARDGTHLPRSDSRRALGKSGDSLPEDAARPTTSFSERLAKSKEDALARKAKEERIEKGRSKGFSVDAAPDAHSRRSNGLAPSADRNGHSKRATTDVMRRPNGLHHENTPNGRNAPTRTSQTDGHSRLSTNGMFTFRAAHPSSNDDPKSNSTTNHPSSDTDSSLSVQEHPASPKRKDQEDLEPHSYDPFTQTHLTKRYIPHPTLTRELSDKELYTLPRLLREVKAPHYDPPDCETDFVLLALLASKSQPYDQKPTHRTNDENKPQEDAFVPGAAKKFMVLHLTDLKWDLDLFLFGPAFDAFWKLTPGTLLAILNPAIMPPKSGQTDTGRFSLKLASAEESVLEIGVARDLGWCKSLRRDGKACGSWVDRRKTEVCAFHLEMGIEREGRRGRMEVNGMWRSHEGSGRGRGRGGQQQQRGGGQQGRGGTFHREYGRLYDVPPTAAGPTIPGAPSAASLLDAEDRPFNLEAEEASRKRIAAAQRERDLARKLGQMGHGVGAEYLRSTTAGSIDASTIGSPSSPTKKNNGGSGAFFEKPSVSSLGLLANRAEHARLSPPKDRKRHFGLGAVSSAGPEAMGWGDARKAGLLLQAKERQGGSSSEQASTISGVAERGRKIAAEREGDGGSGRGTGSRSPQKKRARFMLEQGIREPGRSSLGQSGAGAEEVVSGGGIGADGRDEDDDGLDIV